MRDQLARFFFVWKEVDIWKSSEYLWEPSVTSLLSSQIVGAVQRARAVNKITMLVWQIQMNKREFHDIWGELRVSKVFFYKMIFLLLSCDIEGKYVIIKILFRACVRKVYFYRLICNYSARASQKISFIPMS